MKKRTSTESRKDRKALEEDILGYIEPTTVDGSGGNWTNLLRALGLNLRDENGYFAQLTSIPDTHERVRKLAVDANQEKHVDGVQLTRALVRGAILDVAEKELQGIAIINLEDGETAYFDGKKYQVGVDPQYDYPYAKADTFIVGKNGPELEASGGDCAVISIYEADNKIGAILHIDVASIGNQMHSDGLIDKLLAELPDISPEAADVNVFVDVENAQGLQNAARQWHQMIVEKLQAHFSQLSSFTKGSGKNVRLNTETGELSVLDVNERLIFTNRKKQ